MTDVWTLSLTPVPCGTAGLLGDPPWPTVMGHVRDLASEWERELAKASMLLNPATVEAYARRVGMQTELRTPPSEWTAPPHAHLFDARDVPHAEGIPCLEGDP